MSYARFGQSGSNVYVFLHVDGYLECCGCWLTETQPNGFGSPFKAATTDGMLAHLTEHVAAGHHVTLDTVKALIADAAENDAWIAKRAAEVTA